MEVVNVRGESEDIRGIQMIEKRRPSPHIITEHSQDTRVCQGAAGDHWARQQWTSHT